MTLYNIYFGTIGKTLGTKYRFTGEFKTESQAKNFAKKAATSFYYKNEGKYGIPNFKQIISESKITGVSVEELYKDHINDMMRWYIIPTEIDTIPQKKLKY